VGSGSWCRTVYSFTHIVCVQLAEKIVQFSSVFNWGKIRHSCFCTAPTAFV
jgi:hypothetical protein